MADSVNTPFTMHGARDAIAGGLAHIEEQVKAIEQALVENPALAFDLARTLVESTCRSILTDRKVAYSDSDDLPRLFKLASQHLSFLPPTASAEHQTRDSLTRTLNGLNTAIHGICELRNRCGFASHGSDNPRPPMESVQALLAAQAADAIVGFLYRVHLQDRTPPSSQRALYDANPAFNESVDETFGPIRIFDSEFRPSEVLFEMEPETYRIQLSAFELEPDAADPGVTP